MNFYIATDPETGRKIWGKRQDEAKKVDPSFEKRDIDTSQDGLIRLFQEYEDRIRDLQQQAVEGVNLGIAAGIEIASGEPDGSGAAEEGSTPSLPQLDVLSMNAPQLAPIALDVIERVGELGEDAFEALDDHQGRHGVSGQFSRGVHILSVLSAGEHQLTRLFFRSRKEKKWGGA